jgi:excisionase family DNA binding protein
VAERLQLSERTLWRRLKDGTIPSFHVGRLVRIDERELERTLRRPA